MAEQTESYGDWRSLERAIKDAAKKAAAKAGPGVSAASVSAQIRQARFDRFLSRVFADGEESEWLLKGGMGMLARVPRSRTTLYPVVDQIADKVCATVDTNYPGGKRSSRVKDRVDLVVLAHRRHRRVARSFSCRPSVSAASAQH